MPVQSFRSSIAMNRTFGFVYPWRFQLALLQWETGCTGVAASQIAFPSVTLVFPVRFGFDFLLQQRVLIAFSTCSVRWIRYVQSISLSSDHDPSEQVVGDLLHTLMGPLLSYAMTARVQVPRRA